MEDQTTKNTSINSRSDTVRQIRTLQSDIAELQRDNGDTQKIATDKNNASAPKTSIPRPMFPEPQEITNQKQVPNPIPTKNTQTTLQNPFLNQEEIASKEKNSIEIARHKIISPIRTYTSDIADAVKEDNTSIVKIAVAENERRIKNQSGNENTSDSKILKNLIFFIFSLILIAGGIYTIYFFGFIKLPMDNKVPITQKDPSFISGDQTIEISADNVSKDFLTHSIQDAINHYRGPVGSVEIINFTTTTQDLASKTQITKKISVQDFFKDLELNASDALIRSFNTDFIFAIHKSPSLGNQPFIILSTNSYENSFAGMLNWENLMIKDLKDTLVLQIDENATSTATTTNPNNFFGNSNTQNTPLALSQYSFQDAVIQNHDVRIIKNNNDRIILMYTFIDTNTLIITNNEYTLNEAINRLIKNKFIR
jgi:hypothetical protein